MLKKAIEKGLLPICKYRFKKKGIILMSGVKFNKETNFKGRNKVYKNSEVKNTTVDFGTYIGWNSILNNCTIGKYCSIAPYVEIIYGRHPLREFASTHPSFFSTKEQAGFTFTNHQLYQEHRLIGNQYSAVIGNDVWIGYGASIVEGAKIGDGAIIGAKAVVTGDIEPYSINVGVPAKKIGYRFDKQTVDKLLKLSWWDKDIEWIKDNYNKILDNLDSY